MHLYIVFTLLSFQALNTVPYQNIQQQNIWEKWNIHPFERKVKPGDTYSHALVISLQLQA